MDQICRNPKSRVNSVIIVFELFIIAILTTALLNINPTKSRSNNILTKDGLIYKTGESIPYTGHILDTLQNKVILEYDVVNGKKDGAFYVSTLSGIFTVYGLISENKNVGCWKYFYDGGQLQCTGYYDNDLPIGTWQWFYENGLKKSEGTFIKGRREGKWIEYDDDGYPIRFINYFDDEVISKIEIHKPKLT
jgi:antitoxin component YwqK of YwqJK toxin-antitoxin module